jgi:excisionase family DNA binding protein
MEIERFRDQDVLLTFEEAAALLRVSRATMYRLLESGRLVGHKVGRGWRFYRTDLHSFVTASPGFERNGPAEAQADEIPSWSHKG